MNVHLKEDMALVELVGRVIFENIVATEKELEALLSTDLSEVFIKLDKLSYLDSSALGMLLKLNQTARTSGRKITFLSLPSRIRSIFVTAHLDTIFNIASDEEAADIASAFANL